MRRRPRGNHTAGFKAKMALAAVKGDKTLAELGEQFDIHPNQVTQWKTQPLESAAGVFGEARADQPAPVDLKALHAKICELTLENDVLVCHRRNRRPARYETWSSVLNPTIAECRRHRGRILLGAQQPVF